MATKTKDIPVKFIEPGTHRVLITPQWNGDDSITGAVGTGGATTGKNELPVSGFTEEQTAAIKSALKDYDHVYLTIGATDTTAYRLIHMIEAAGVATKFVIYPKLQADATAADPVDVGGKDIQVDIGIIGEDGIKMEGAAEAIEYKDEVGRTVKKFTNLTGIKATIPALSMTIENFLLMMPKSFFIIKDGVLDFAYGITAGFQKAQEIAVKIVPRDDATDLERTIVFEKALMSSDTLNLDIGKEPMKSFPLVFDSCGDSLVTIGTASAAYATA